MLRNRNVLIVTFLLLAAFGTWVAAAGSLVDQRSVLSGHVLNICPPGKVVKEGEVLVVVGTITGPTPAVRATADGVVREAFVKQGDIIRQGDVVIRLEPAR